jgi:hypothetical protein
MTRTFYFEIVFCDYEYDYPQAEFLNPHGALKLYEHLAFPYNDYLSYPWFEMASGSHSDCGQVVQTLDMTNALKAWTNTFNSATYNTLNLNGLTWADAGTYTFAYTASILDNRSLRSLTLTINVVLCGYE